MPINKSSMYTRDLSSNSIRFAWPDKEEGVERSKRINDPRASWFYWKLVPRNYQVAPIPHSLLLLDIIIKAVGSSYSGISQSLFFKPKYECISTPVAHMVTLEVLLHRSKYSFLHVE